MKFVFEKKCYNNHRKNNFYGADFMKNLPKQEQGISAWRLLPWLICMALAGILYLFFTNPELILKNMAKNPVIQAPAGQTELPSQSQSLPSPLSGQVDSYHQAVQKAAKSVVNIYTTQHLPNHPYANDPIFRHYIEQYYGISPSRQQTNLGSGVIASKDGHIITNAHVIQDADEITVILHDGTKVSAKVVGRDADSDLAVIKVNHDNLTPIDFRQEPILVGDVALAIGNPFGVGQTVTQGIISAVGRVGVGVSNFEEFIQTDAAINPGNSGGALIDSQGRLIGVNTAIYSRSGGSMGIGFAIPTVIVRQVMDDLIKDGYVSRGWLGVEIARTYDDPTSLEKTTGLLVAKVWQDSPAQKAGIQAGDVLIAINGTKLEHDYSLVNFIAKHKPNTKLDVEVLRNQEKLVLDVVLAQRPNVINPSQSNDQQAQIQELLRQLQKLNQP